MEKEFLRAVKEAKTLPRNFTQTVEIAINLKNLDFKKPESRIKGEVVLPHGRGKPAKICIFAEGDLASRGKKLGLTVISKKELEELAKNKRKARKFAENHDFFIAQADFMPKIGKLLGPVLGRRNKMPKPIPPTAPLEPVIKKLEKTVFLDSKGKNVLHSRIGSEKMDDKKLVENALTILEFLKKTLPKGMDNISSIYLKTTMGKSVKVI